MSDDSNGTALKYSRYSAPIYTAKLVSHHELHSSPGTLSGFTERD